MKLHGGLKVRDLLKEYPFLRRILRAWNASFGALDNPIVRRPRGCLEVSQDVAAIRGLEGERRLPDWD